MENSLVVIYFGDETDYRKKRCGLTLIDQLILSARSVRDNWSVEIEIILYHTGPLSQATIQVLKQLNVCHQHSPIILEPNFPLSNKILIGDLYKGPKDLVFLDCDTIIHRKPSFKTDKKMLVAYDALKNIDYEEYVEVFEFLNLRLPSGTLFEKPSYEYYYSDNTDQFPVFNSGVFYLKNSVIRPFFFMYRDIFIKLYRHFKLRKWNFYIEQIAFCAAIIISHTPYGILPKGYNFICTPRAPFLLSWPKEQIVIEHYAGDNSAPMNQ